MYMVSNQLLGRMSPLTAFEFKSVENRYECCFILRYKLKWRQDLLLGYKTAEYCGLCLGFLSAHAKSAADFRLCNKGGLLPELALRGQMSQFLCVLTL